ncbi:MAG: hypothetical protein ABIZ91_13805 [Gemmatimonadaceae bacterium]
MILSFVRGTTTGTRSWRVPGCGLALLAMLAATPLAAQDNNCAPPTSRRASTASLDGLHGSFLLLMYASEGPRAGRIAGGTLDLSPAAPKQRERGTLYVGTASIDLARIGALFTGSLLSRDPSAPGVTLERGAGAGEAAFVFGSKRHTRDTRDTPSTPLPVTRATLVEISARGLRGFWRSTGGEATGYFCATRY